MHKQIIDTLNRRYATKAFDPSKKIDQETLNTIEESLRLAPSSFGLEGRGFFVIESQDIKNKLRPFCFDQPQITDASHLIVLCRSTKERNQITSEHLQNISETRQIDPSYLDGFKTMLDNAGQQRTQEQIDNSFKNQTYIALGFAMMTAALLQVDSCPLEGFQPEKVDEILGLKDKGFASVSLLPIGYRADSDKYATLKKVRKNKDEVIFHL